MPRFSPRLSVRHVALGAILLLATALRLFDIGFGLPSIYDPDEPFFMLKSLELLSNGTLNPHWFGHPGSTTIYLVALIDAAVVGFGFLTGAYTSIGDFTKAAFADPSMLFIPARTAMAILAVISVWLTYLVARRIHGTAVALVASGLLAINALHIAWSQVVRTDIHASVFMLASLLFAIRACERGKRSDYLLAGLFAGFAIATKWPAASIFAAILGATGRGSTMGPGRARDAWIGFAAAVGGLLAGIFIASPFIFIDWHTVLANVASEVKSRHLGHTGGTFLENLWWYSWGPVRDSVGTIGLLLIVAGMAVSAVRSSLARYTLLPFATLFIALICSQSLVWARWILPAMPVLLIFAAAAIVALGEALGKWLRISHPRSVIALVGLLAAVPSAQAAAAELAERMNDTRGRAADWAIAHIPRGSSVVLEHIELRLREEPWRILFPVGRAGCVDAKALLDSGVHSESIQRMRQDSPIVDLGNVDATRLTSCRADFAILTYYDLYRAEARQFPRELGKYDSLFANSRTVALFSPRRGVSGGPTVRIVAVQQHGPRFGAFEHDGGGAGR